MTESIHIFERYCRLCAKENDVTLLLFSTEAAEMLLLEKLRKYLQLEISENDKFPKSICLKCSSKLQSLCEFVESVSEAQRNFDLLCSQNEKLNNSTIEAIKEEKVEFTEICIDPMDVMNMSDENSQEIYKYPWADELVTLKLISKDEIQIENHEKEGMLKKTFECEVCNKSFLVEQLLKKHSCTNTKDEQYACYTCPRRFTLQAELHNHLKTHRNTTHRYKYGCNVCGRRFKAHNTYDAHMKIHKTMMKAFTCDVCGRSYSNWAGLKVHSITHSSEKPFPCTLCEKKFKRNQELKFHMNCHTGEKPYKCKYCNKSFASTGNLYSHRNRLHSNHTVKMVFKTRDSLVVEKEEETKKEYKYKCHFCKKGCGRQENYVYHMFQHTGLKPFKCTKCPQTFITQRSLSLHYDNVHPTVRKPAMPIPKFCPILRKWL